MTSLSLRNKYMLVIAPLFLISIILALVAYPLFYDKVYEGIILEDRDVSGKTKEELLTLLTEWDKQSREKAVMVYHNDQAYPVKANDINFSIDLDSTADTVWNYGRVGPWLERIRAIRIAGGRQQPLPVRVSFDESKLDKFIETWKAKIDEPPHNATVSLVSGGIVPEVKGRRLLEDKLKSSLLRAFYRSDIQQISMPVIQVEPKITADSLRQSGIVVMQSVYSTRFNTGDVKRSTNVRLAAERINGQILQPGQAFSFNDIVGPRDKAHGFQEAMEIFDGELVPGIGGGVCQVSSTLYNAVLLANLDITERINHAKPLSYIDLGLDATVVYGILDFRFVNTSDAPVMIASEVRGDTLYAAVFGREKIKETIDIVVTDLKEIPPVTVKKPDSDLFEGQTKIENKGAPGYDLKVYRVVSRGGAVLKREFLSKDQYAADNIIVKVGTKPKPKPLKK